MATPTDEQQLRATLRRLGRGPREDAVKTVILNAVELLGGIEAVRPVAAMMLDLRSSTSSESLPPLMGAAEAADVLGMKATNLKRLSPPLPVAAVVSGRIPIYLAADVHAAKVRRDARRAAA